MKQRFRLGVDAGGTFTDLVILDLMLPGMSGLEILTALRADGATEALPVMMLTAKRFFEFLIKRA